MSGQRALIVGEMKRCNQCSEWKPLGDYRSKKARCNECLQINHRNWCANNPERLKTYKSRYSVKSSQRARTNRNNPVGKAKQLVTTARNRANRAKMQFDLSWEIALKLMLENNFKCARTGVTFDFTVEGYTKSNRNPRSPSIDRIDNSLGYTIDNVQIVCWFYNVAKSTFDENDVWDFMRKAILFADGESV